MTRTFSKMHLFIVKIKCPFLRSISHRMLQHSPTCKVTNDFLYKYETYCFDAYNGVIKCLYLQKNRITRFPERSLLEFNWLVLQHTALFVGEKKRAVSFGSSEHFYFNALFRMIKLRHWLLNIYSPLNLFTILSLIAPLIHFKQFNPLFESCIQCILFVKNLQR